MTAQIGERVKWFRDRKIDPNGRPMTLQALADRCEELGLPLGRVTLTKLEGGNRQAITPAEVMVLAAALEVAPIELLFPVGSGEQVEMLPGRMMSARAVMHWFSGSLNLEAHPDGTTMLLPPSPGHETTVKLLEEHAAIVRQWTQVQAAAIYEEVGRVPEQAITLESFRYVTTDSLRRIRAELRRREATLPPLPPGLSLNEGESAGEEPT